jgi:Cys-rich radical ribosomally synthesized peptide
MLVYDSHALNLMLGAIDGNVFSSAKTCISQCAGCMCNCRCSCSGGNVSDFEWEII